VRDVVDQLDLKPFLRAYRNDGHGHPAYDPKTLLGVLLYAYAIGVRSSRQIERHCTEDLAFRVLAGNQAPDHVTIARFRARHQTALAGFLVRSLKLCAAGLVRLGVVALDGTKVAANAASHTTHVTVHTCTRGTSIYRVPTTPKPGPHPVVPARRSAVGGSPAPHPPASSRKVAGRRMRSTGPARSLGWWSRTRWP
jgi:transposase